MLFICKYFLFGYAFQGYVKHLDNIRMLDDKASG